MRKISIHTIIESVAKLVEDTALYLRADVYAFYQNAYASETHPDAKYILGKLLENADLARTKKVPYCQDTGLEVIFCEIGQNVLITDGSLETAIQDGVALGSKRGYLRQSIVQDPILRDNTLTNTPVVIHYKIVLEDTLTFSCIAKGFGSENKGSVTMMNPTATASDIQTVIIESVKKAGTSACPPFLIGVGIGGTMDKACELAKEALLLPIGLRNSKSHYADLEETLIKAINNLNIGPLGFGGGLTVMDLKIKEYPTHIAGLPVAVNIGCHAVRTGSITVLD